MHFSVSQLLKESSGSIREYEVDDVLPDIKDLPARHMQGKVRLLRTDQGIWVSTVLDSMVTSACCRCLNTCEQPISLEIEEEFFPLLDISNSTKRVAVDDGEEHFYIGQNHILDLMEAVRQYASISLPMKPMCREECAGLCAICGANLNETTCQCDKIARDARWSALLELVATDYNED